MVEEKQFARVVFILKEAFPKFEFNPRLYWEMLQDLNGGCLELATTEICKTLEEIYPGTNLIAILRQRTLNITKQKLLDGNNLKLTDDRCDPPPPEWKQMMVKLAQSKSIDPIERAKGEGRL